MLVDGENLHIWNICQHGKRQIHSDNYDDDDDITFQQN